MFSLPIAGAAAIPVTVTPGQGSSDTRQRPAAGQSTPPYWSFVLSFLPDIAASQTPDGGDCNETEFLNITDAESAVPEDTSESLSDGEPLQQSALPSPHSKTKRSTRRTLHGISGEEPLQPTKPNPRKLIFTVLAAAIPSMSTPPQPLAVSEMHEVQLPTSPVEVVVPVETSSLAGNGTQPISSEAPEAFADEAAPPVEVDLSCNSIEANSQPAEQSPHISPAPTESQPEIERGQTAMIPLPERVALTAMTGKPSPNVPLPSPTNEPLHSPAVQAEAATLEVSSSVRRVDSRNLTVNERLPNPAWPSAFSLRVHSSEPSSDDRAMPEPNRPWTWSPRQLSEPENSPIAYGSTPTAASHLRPRDLTLSTTPQTMPPAPPHSDSPPSPATPIARAEIQPFYTPSRNPNEIPYQQVRVETEDTMHGKSQKEIRIPVFQEEPHNQQDDTGQDGKARQEVVAPLIAQRTSGSEDRRQGLATEGGSPTGKLKTTAAERPGHVSMVAPEVGHALPAKANLSTVETAALPPGEQILEPSDPELIQRAIPSARESRDIRLPLDATGLRNVEIRLTERAGSVQISVHSPDKEVRSILHDNVKDLVGAIERKGLIAEPITETSLSGSSHRSGDESNHELPVSTGPESRQTPGKDLDAAKQQQNPQRRPWIEELTPQKRREFDGDAWKEALEVSWQTHS